MIVSSSKACYNIFVLVYEFREMVMTESPHIFLCALF